MSALIRVPLSVLLAVPLAAQAPFAWRAVDGATATAVGVLWAHGYDDDPPEQCGAARVLVGCRLARARAAVPDLVASGLQVGGDYALAFAVVPAGEVARAAAFLSALLDDAAVAASDDDLALLIARTALAADDAQCVYPGSELRARARHVFFAGTPAARGPEGNATAIAALSPADVRRLLRQPVAAWGGGCGIVTDALRDAVAALPWPDVPAPAARSLPRAGAGSAAIDERVNPRVDSPFVAAAFPAPPPATAAAFAVGVEVARTRAVRRFKSRGSEARANAPFVHWSWLAADPLVVFCRRGEDPEQLLPGQRPAAGIDDETAATVRELEALLADLRAVPPSRAEVQMAVTALHGELMRPSAAAEALPRQLVVLLLAAHHGIDASALADVTPAAAGSALADALAEGRASWHAVLPEPRSDHGFRSR